MELPPKKAVLAFSLSSHGHPYIYIVLLCSSLGSFSACPSIIPLICVNHISFTNLSLSLAVSLSLSLYYTNIYIYIHTYIYAGIHKYIYTYTCTYTLIIHKILTYTCIHIHIDIGIKSLRFAYITSI